MKSKRLALRVTLNSVGTLVAAYLCIQTLAYLRDGIILGLPGLGAYLSSVAVFMGLYVLPPCVVFGAVLYLAALPIQRAALRLEAGETLPPHEAEKTRVRILRYGGLVIAMNEIGFAAGFLILELLSGGMSSVFRFDRMVILLSNLSAGFVYANAQIALNDMAFAQIGRAHV